MEDQDCVSAWDECGTKTHEGASTQSMRQNCNIEARTEIATGPSGGDGAGGGDSGNDQKRILWNLPWLGCTHQPADI